MLHLPHSTPEAQGVDSRALNRFLHAFMALKWTHGVMVLRHGHVIAEHYRRLCSAFDRHQLFSLSKSFTSSAIGIAIDAFRSMTGLFRFSRNTIRPPSPNRCAASHSATC